MTTKTGDDSGRAFNVDLFFIMCSFDKHFVTFLYMSQRHMRKLYVLSRSLAVKSRQHQQCLNAVRWVSISHNYNIHHSSSLNQPPVAFYSSVISSPEIKSATNGRELPSSADVLPKRTRNFCYFLVAASIWTCVILVAFNHQKVGSVTFDKTNLVISK